MRMRLGPNIRRWSGVVGTDRRDRERTAGSSAPIRAIILRLAVMTARKRGRGREAGESGKEEVETSEQEAIINWCVGITEAKKNSFPHFDLEERLERNRKCQRKLEPGLVEQILGLRITSP